MRMLGQALSDVVDARPNKKQIVAMADMRVVCVAYLEGVNSVIPRPPSRSGVLHQRGNLHELDGGAPTEETGHPLNE